MANKNVYEVLDEFKNAKTKQDRIEILLKNNNWALQSVLQGALHPDIKFIGVPPYQKVDVPPGMSYNHINDALRRGYLFLIDHAAKPEGLTEKRQTELLIQLLESLEPKEAEVYANMMKKDLKIPYLTKALVNEAFPGLLP